MYTVLVGEGGGRGRYTHKTAASFDHFLEVRVLYVSSLLQRRGISKFETKVLKSILSPKKDKVTKETRKLHEEERNSLYCLPSCGGWLVGCLMALFQFETLSKLSRPTFSFCAHTYSRKQHFEICNLLTVIMFTNFQVNFKRLNLTKHLYIHVYMKPQTQSGPRNKMAEFVDLLVKLHLRVVI